MQKAFATRSFLRDHGMSLIHRRTDLTVFVPDDWCDYSFGLIGRFARNRTINWLRKRRNSGVVFFKSKVPDSAVLPSHLQEKLVGDFCFQLHYEPAIVNGEEECVPNFTAGKNAFIATLLQSQEGGPECLVLATDYEADALRRVTTSVLTINQLSQPVDPKSWDESIYCWAVWLGRRTDIAIVFGLIGLIVITIFSATYLLLSNSLFLLRLFFSVSSIVVASTGLFIAASLYVLKRRKVYLYAFAEIAVGLAVVAIVWERRPATMNHVDGLDIALKMAGGLYIMVRGLDNANKAVGGSNWFAKAWHRVFGKDEYRDRN